MPLSTSHARTTGQTGIALGILSSLLAFLPTLVFFTQLAACSVFLVRKRDEGTTGTGEELKKASDVWSEISVVFWGSCSHFLQHNPLQCSTRRTRPSRAQCQRSPMSIDATVLCERAFFMGRQGGGGITHQVINAMGSFGAEKGGGGFDHSQPEKSFFHRSSLSRSLSQWAG